MAETLRDDPDPGRPEHQPVMETVEGIRALLVPVEGEVRDVVLTARGDDHLSALREHTGAQWLDVVEVATDGMAVTVWVDDEGLLRDRPANLRIGKLLAAVLGGHTPYIAGDVVVTGPPDDDGATTSIARDARDELTEWWS